MSIGEILPCMHCLLHCYAFFVLIIVLRELCVQEHYYMFVAFATFLIAQQTLHLTARIIKLSKSLCLFCLTYFSYLSFTFSALCLFLSFFLSHVQYNSVESHVLRCDCVLGDRAKE